ncbi:hypothetical protein CKO38_14720, partial [Rhodospirillum rubrum]|nr:hypothetical protein [Rhodospirillum rubrum]MBK1677900.1 hypothetical protein [Rhodospirillum rubrum]
PLVSAPETSIPVDVIPGATVAEPPEGPAAVEDKPVAVKPAKAPKAPKTTPSKDPAVPKAPRKTTTKTKAAPKPAK